MERQLPSGPLALLFAFALAVPVFGGRAVAGDVFNLDASVVGSQRAVGTDGLPSGVRGASKLTLGLDTLASEFQAYQLKVQRGDVPVDSFVTQATMAQVVAEKVLVDAVATDDPLALTAALETLGAEVKAVAGRVVSALVPLSALPELDVIESLKFARPALSSTRAGSVTSQGDRAQYSDYARTDFDVTGLGQIVGVLSDSFDCSGNGSYAADEASGDLPVDVILLDDSACPGTDEGRAMAQIVHDVAPGARIAFHTAVNGEADFAQGIRDLAAAGASVIVDDVWYFAEPMFQDGVIAQAVDDVTALGVSYFSSAGNSARNSYESPFRPSGAFLDIGDGPQQFHDFDPGPAIDTWQQLRFSGDKVPFILQWDKPFFSVSGAPGSTLDIDFCVSTAPHESGLLGCSNDANIGRDPFELLFLSGSGTVYLAILHYGGSFPNVMKYIWTGGVSDLEHATNSPTSYGHANAAGANAVGAADYRDTPAFGTAPPVLEDFSSAGGVPILFDSFGNRTYIERQKPDFTAPDGGNNTFFGRDVEPDGFPNFFGTSAAAPHAAGVGALLRQCLSSSSPGRISDALKASAIDIVRRQSGQSVGSGRDGDSGAGLIDAEAALRLACLGPSEGDEAEKIGIWRSRDRRFYLDYDGSGSWTPGDIISAPFGFSADTPVVGDWNNDGVDQIGIWRPSERRFYLDYDGSDSWTNRDLITASFGFQSDIPVVGDWNGDGRDQIGVWRPSERRFYRDYDGSNSWTTGDTISAPFGFSSDIPLVGDWNGDGTDQIGIWRPGSRRFYLDFDGSGAWSAADLVSAPFGFSSDIPVVGDWNADGIDEIGVWRPGNRRFFLDSDRSLSWTTGDTITSPFGLGGDIPLAGNW